MTPLRLTGGRARRRAGRRTNLALLGLLFGAFGSGWLAFWSGTVDAARVVTIAHGALGLGLVLLVPWKSVIVQRGLRRAAPRHGRAVGVALAACLLLCLATGVLHVLDGYRPVLGVPALAVHVGSGVLAVPLVVVHAWGRRQRPRSADLSRRTVVVAGMLGIGSLATYGVIETLSAALELPGRDRRATGSYERGSGQPDEMPVTQWFTDSVPSLDGESWQLAVVPPPWRMPTSSSVRTRCGRCWIAPAGGTPSRYGVGCGWIASSAPFPRGHGASTSCR